MGKYFPGQSGNPGGRPKESDWLKHLARRHTEDCIRIAAEFLHNEELEPRDRMAALQILLDRGYGKPRQEFTGEDGAPLLDVGAGLLDMFKRLAGEKPASEIDVTPTPVLQLVDGESDTDTQE